MKVQEDVLDEGRESVLRMDVMAGNSVEVSGVRSCVNWDRG